MRIFRSEAEFDLEKCVAALGMFDGVHIGHQALIRRAQALARELDCPCVVCTFDRHPLSVLKPERAPRMLLTLQERLEKFAAMGVDGALVQRFSAEYAATDPQGFLEGLVERLGVQGIVAGFNYSFGAGGYGNAEMLRREAAHLGYVCDIVEPVMEGGEAVSSTLIRRLIDRGEAQRAEKLLMLC